MGYISLILLILLGIVLMILDFLVIPGGVVAILGVLCMIGGVVTSFVQFGTTVGILTLVLTAVVTLGSFWLMMRTKTWRKLQLKTQIDSKMNEIDESKLAEGMEGVAVSRLAPTGTGLFGDTEAEVVSMQGFIDQNTPIVIRKIEGSKIIVENSHQN
ncbi:MAG: NfeD family protein [Bacteroidales bacterium]|nr:NfeD family protein [Bacteroidales bacterium]